MSFARAFLLLSLLIVACGMGELVAADQPTPLLTCQGRLTNNGTAATGTHVFAFSILAPGGAVQWSATGISLTVSDGLYAVVLGDTTVSGMSAIPSSILSQTGLTLRIQADGQTLSPDVAIIPAVQSNFAFSVAAGAVGSAQLQAGSVGTAQLQAGAVGSAQLQAGSVGTAQLQTGAVTAAILDPSLSAELTPKVRIITAWSGSLTISPSDANGAVVALCGTQSLASPAVSITFPAAASFPAGAVVRLRFHTTVSTSTPGVVYTLASGDTLTVDQSIYQASSGSPALSAATNVLPLRAAFVSDGVSAWYELP